MTDAIKRCKHDACPSNEELLGVLTGELAEDRVGVVLQCCESCAICEGRLDQLEHERASADTVDRDPSPDDSQYSGEAGFQEFRAKLAEMESNVEVPFTLAESTLKARVRSVPKPALDSARTFGDYQLISEIARGGMGIVYRAKQLSVDRIVAVKLIRGTHPEERERQRLFKEARAAARLEHPSIVPVYEVGEVDNQPFFSMRYVEGESLADLLKLAPIIPAAAAKLVTTVAGAIEHAHSQSIVHRDIKPANILLDVQGNPLVTDFGLAKFADAASGITLDGQIVGTPSYMSPEQAAGNNAQVDAAADVYSLGAVLYACLTGRPPFHAASANATLTQVLQDEVVPPSRLTSEIPSDLETICLKCLQKRPADRYESVKVLRDELTRFINHEPIRARPVSVAVRSWKWIRRNPIGATLTVALLMLMVAIGAGVGSTKYSAQLKQSLSDEKRAKSLLQQHEKDLAVALQSATQANEEAEQSKYYRLITLSKTAMDRGDSLMATEYLKQIGSHPERWEWRYLTRCTQTTIPPIRVKNSPSGILTLAVSSDRSQGVFLGADKSGTMTFFDTVTGQVQRKVQCGGYLNHQAAFNSDLSRALVRNDSVDPQYVQVWDTVDGRLLKQFVARYKIQEMAADPELNWAVAYDRGLSWGQAGVRVIDVQNQSIRQLANTDSWSVIDVAFHPDAKSVVVAGRKKSTNRGIIAVYSVPEFKLKSMGTSTYVPRRLCVGNEFVFAGGSDDRIHILDFQTLEQKRQSAQLGYQIEALSLNEDESRVAVAGQTSSVQQFDVESFEQIAAHIAHKLPLRQLEYAGEVVWASGLDGMVTGWPVNEDSLRETRKIENEEIRCLSFSPDGESIVVGCNTDGIVYQWGRNSTDEVSRYEPERGQKFGVMSIGFDVSGNLVTFGWDGMARVWDRESRNMIATIKGKHTKGIQSACFDSKGRYAASCSTDKTVGIWDLEARRLIEQRPIPYQTFAAAFSGDNEYLAVGGTHFPKAFQILHQPLWDKAREPIIPKMQPNGIRSLAFSGNGKWLAFGDVSHRVGVIDTDSWNTVWESNIALDAARAIAFSPDSSRLVIGSGSGRVVLFDTATGQEIMRLTGCRDRVLAIAFSPDGSAIAAGDKSGQVVLWDTQQ